MPELKRVPQAGKMNRDFHERILPSGEYREALNINIGRSETSEVGTVENILGNEQVGTDIVIPTGARTIGSYRDNGNERIYYFVTTNDSFDGSNSGNHWVIEFNQLSGNSTALVNNTNLNFHKDFPVTGINLVDELLLWTDNRNEPRKINVDRARQDTTFYSSDDRMALAKFAPYEAATILEIRNTDGDGNLIDSNFLRDKLPRFTYRWRFDDGEYSVLAPFTPIIFSRLNKTISSSLASIQAAGEVAEFVNEVKSIDFTVPTPSGKGIVSVELIYKESTTSTMYIVEDKPVASAETVNFNYASQDPFRTVPPSQLTRVSDAVPRKAASQELAGGRVVFGNYLQNYNLPEIDFTVGIQTATENVNLPNFSVKSRRTYQVGIVLADRFGRVTPVILSSSGGDTIFVNAKTGASAFQGLTISFNNVDQIPDEFFSYRVVIKQREQEYYNWISATNSTGVIRAGDSINKIPRDTTAEDPGNSSISPVDTSVFPKVFGTTNQTGELIKVQQIVNPSGTAIVPGSPSSGTFTVYETEPFKTELNIFYETSSGGLISELASGASNSVNIEFYNSYIYKLTGSHIEVNRLRLGFNEPFFDVGVRAHIVNEDYAGEERRSNALIHSSGFFNSRTGINYLNQFNEAEGGITISLDPSDGSIQKLFAEDTQLIIFQEDKVSRSPIDKDFIYSAEGGAVPVTSSTQYLGTIAPYAGEYGISQDPQSFSVYGTAKYFTDRNRGVVMRLSNDGLTEISKSGMADFFRDSLRSSTSVIGSFSEYHNEYNLTIVGQAYDRNEDTNVATAAQGYFTLSYDSDTSGWVSFKSFNQENGLTLNNRYYTFSGGKLWLHDSQTSPRNTFYGNPTSPSYIDFIFNDSPSAVKEFKTLGYEGKAGWECRYIETDIDTAGTVPVEAEYVDVTLNVTDVTAPNISFQGEQTRQVVSGAQTTFILVVSPISTQYRLTAATDVTLTITGTVTVVDSFSDGLIYFAISTTQTADSTIDVAIGGTGAELAFDVSKLTVNILASGVTNASRVGSLTRGLNDVGAQSFDVTFDSDDTYYLNTDTLSILGGADAPTGLSGIIRSPVTVAYAADIDNVTYSVPVTVTEALATGSITFSGSAILKPIQTWTAFADVTGYTTTADALFGTSYGRSPNEALSTIQADLSLQVSDLTTNVILADTFDALVPVGYTISTGPTISDDHDTITWRLQSTITTTDTTSTVTAVGRVVAGTIVGATPYHDHENVLAASAPDITFTNTGNTPVTLASDSTWATFSETIVAPESTSDISIADNTETDARTAVITVSPESVRLTAITAVTFDIDQLAPTP